MKVLFLTRATLYAVYGGDTVQIESTAKYLRRLGVEVDIKLSGEKIDYRPYDLIHYFNITRPADLLSHIRKSRKPFLISTIFVDYSDYEAVRPKGLASLTRKIFGPDKLEYVKALARWVKNGETISSFEYLVQGHKRSVRKIALEAAALLPNSESEYRRFATKYNVWNKYYVVHNAIDPEMFSFTPAQVAAPRDNKQVICVSRIEGRKNHINLIRALNGTDFQLTLVGMPAPNHISYYDKCRQIAGPNIRFADFMPQKDVVAWYLKAKVHVLPSWNETCGLSSMEAAYAGCNIVITNKGDTRDYFGNHAWYCNPADPKSIYEAVRSASTEPVAPDLRALISRYYTWDETARKTLAAYREVLKRKNELVNT